MGAAKPDFARVLALLEQRAPRPLSIEEMTRMLGLDRYDRRGLKIALEGAVAERCLRRIGKTRYQWLREPLPEPKPAGLPAARRGGRGSRGGVRVEGHYRRVRAGFGFVEVLGRAAERYPRDILVPAGLEGGALHGDRVEVEVARRDPRLRRVVGQVTRVVTPVHEVIVGTLERVRAGWWAVPENELLPRVELVGPPLPERAQEGSVARVRITRPAAAGHGPGGLLEEVLGAADDPEVQFVVLAAEHGLRVAFPPAAEEEARGLPEDPEPRDLEGREDLRALPFVTIDGETARDFDDAVCLRPEADGGFTLWVAIADVAHYVRPGTPLDLEASLRGTSVYFPDRAIPMLPPELSSGLCSLKPRRDRLVLVAEMRFDDAAHRRETRVYRGVICSQARLTYTQVAGVLSQASTPEIDGWRRELGPLLPQLEQMLTRMRQFHRHRVAAGSLDLDLPEAMVDLSEEGRSIGLRLLQRNDAHRIIEEFMLEANRAVAQHLRAQQMPLPYRIHESPDPDDVDDLNQFLGAFGFFVDYEERVRPRDVARLLTQLEGHRLARVLSRQVLRSLKQAQYSTSNVGHFGLAFPVYCHFTSPIRRYPDLLVHRQLGRLLDGEVEAGREEAEALEAASVQSSQCERQAMEAERAMLDLRKCEFMLAHLMEPEEGTIVSVTNFGFFVELDSYPVEGLVRADSLVDDRYAFLEEERALRGLRTGRRFRIGDRVRVECTDASLRRRQIDFALLERLEAAAESSRERRPGRAKPRGRRPAGRPKRPGPKGGSKRGRGRRGR